MLNIYLTFKDNCEEVFKYYKSIFGGDYQSFNRFSEMPADEKFPIQEADKNKIMHVSLPIGGHSMLMGSDSLESYGSKLIEGNNFSISYHTKDKPEADKIFHALSKDDKVTMPLADTFWGSYFGSVVDKFSIQWMINCDQQ